MVIGDGKTPAISLPKGQGLVHTLLEEMGKREEEDDEEEEEDAAADEDDWISWDINVWTNMK